MLTRRQGTPLVPVALVTVAVVTIALVAAAVIGVRPAGLWGSDDGPSDAGAVVAAAKRRDLVVAPSGSDSGSGTADDPFKTLGHAFEALRPGDTLSIRGGTYVENLRPQIWPGDADAPIRVSAAPGERPVLQGLLWLREPSHWLISGLTVQWNDANSSRDHMVKIEGGTGWTVSESELFGARSFAALLVTVNAQGEAPTDWSIVGNCIHDTLAAHADNQDHLIYVNTGPTRTAGLIARNILFNAENGEGVKLGGTSPAESVRGVRIQFNTIHNTSQSVLVTGTSTAVVIDRNLLTGSTQTGRTHIRGFVDHAAQVEVTNNVYFEQSRFIWSDSGSITAGSGNVQRDPLFDSETCTGFRPQDPVAAAAGRYAGPLIRK